VLFIIMQRHRFYASPKQFTSLSVLLDEDEAHHLARVLRLKEGARVFVFDGQGAEWEAEIGRVGKRETELKLLAPLIDVVESPLRLTLAQALIKSDKFDWVIQKATELGVTRIAPLITEHSDIRRVDERAEQKLQRWRRIALEAVKQCGRRRLVEIIAPVSFADFCEAGQAEHNLIFSERGGRELREVAAEWKQIAQLNLCVASEGGWSEGELQRAEASGFVPVYLGSRILRTETAAITAVVLAQHLFGDLR
jgi:16S rRNA (uracil1498-N3)-methyltransferase